MYGGSIPHSPPSLFNDLGVGPILHATRLGKSATRSVCVLFLFHGAECGPAELKATHLGGVVPAQNKEYRPKALPHDMRVRGLCRENRSAQVQRTKEHTPKHTGDCICFPAQTSN